MDAPAGLSPAGLSPDVVLGAGPHVVAGPRVEDPDLAQGDRGELPQGQVDQTMCPHRGSLAPEPERPWLALGGQPCFPCRYAIQMHNCKAEERKGKVEERRQKRKDRREKQKMTHRYRTRSLEPVLRQAAREFPAVVLTGPRQSGKTTLLRHMFGGQADYVSLEPPDVRQAATVDPRGFLEMHPPPVILDEVQYAPDLLPYVKEKIAPIVLGREPPKPPKKPPSEAVRARKTPTGAETSRTPTAKHALRRRRLVLASIFYPPTVRKLKL